ncbi:unnamed protein product [Kuraishia capsulata CBS 1993]|uniref:Transcription regulator Rua1 C-terminal domain-containing protein n=1 Tax=Kuraishia capsulata CBS 1993 TaxID=1382522 RepID=W6MSI9_9ASCO|nr:uncharacterized protein KUCA_T00000721001 [Kuraishia capsulata CBS 1993]CDK24755.1 unnamed protein product [Kuraishia capsulata CBS 1993]
MSCYSNSYQLHDFLSMKRDPSIPFGFEAHWPFPKSFEEICSLEKNSLSALSGGASKLDVCDSSEIFDEELAANYFQDQDGNFALFPEEVEDEEMEGGSLIGYDVAVSSDDDVADSEDEDEDKNTSLDQTYDLGSSMDVQSNPNEDKVLGNQNEKQRELIDQQPEFQKPHESDFDPQNFLNVTGTAEPAGIQNSNFDTEVQTQLESHSETPFEDDSLEVFVTVMKSMDPRMCTDEELEEFCMDYNNGSIPLSPIPEDLTEDSHNEQFTIFEDNPNSWLVLPNGESAEGISPKSVMKEHYVDSTLNPDLKTLSDLNRAVRKNSSLRHECYNSHNLSLFVEESEDEAAQASDKNQPSILKHDPGLEQIVDNHDPKVMFQNAKEPVTFSSGQNTFLTISRSGSPKIIHKPSQTFPAVPTGEAAGAQEFAIEPVFDEANICPHDPYCRLSRDHTGAHSYSETSLVAADTKGKDLQFISQFDSTGKKPYPYVKMSDLRIPNNVTIVDFENSDESFWKYERGEMGYLAATAYSPRVFRCLRKAYDEKLAAGGTKSLQVRIRRQGLCPYCQPSEADWDDDLNGLFHDMNNSDYLHHITKQHGIFTTGDLMKSPADFGWGKEVKFNRRCEAKISFTDCVVCPYANCGQCIKVQPYRPSEPNANRLLGYMRHCLEYHNLKKNKGKKDS